MSLIVREAKPGEARAVHALLVAAFESFRPLYTSETYDATVLDAQRVMERMAEGPVFVAEQNGRLVGTAGALVDERGVYVRGMAVHPDARRGGIGRLLLQTCEDFARSAGAPCLWLSTTPFLEQSIALYESFGFQRAAGPTDLFGTPLLSFEKSLQ